jgi:hypothetical protein
VSAFFAWFQDEDDEKPPLSELKLDDFEAIIVGPDGYVALIDPVGFPMEIHNDFHAIGSGSYIAMGAMAAGASATDAVKYTMSLDTRCGGDIISHSISKRKKKKE